jgi:hypothetical protein
MDIAIFFLSGSDFVPVLLSKQDVALLLFPGNLVVRILQACWGPTLRIRSIHHLIDKSAVGDSTNKIAYYIYLIGTWQNMINSQRFKHSQ